MWIALLILLVVAGVFVRPAKPRPRAEADRWQLENDPALLALRDPAEALTRYGTADDARRLIEQGHGDELADLGWRPPEQG